VLGRVGCFQKQQEVAIVALVKKAKELGMIPDSEESGDTEQKCRGSETACTALSQKEKLEILKEIHDSPIGGYAGINCTYRKLKQFINWQGMKNDVEKYIRKCEKCQKNKMTQCRTRMPLVITGTLSTVFDKCSIDTIGQFSYISSHHRYILTEQDDLSKFLIAVPLEDQTEEQIVKAFVDHIALTYGIPQVILSDCGSQFLSETFKNVCKLLGIKHIQSTGFRPESNGSNEHSHESLIEYLTSYVAADLSNWDQWVKYAVFVHNTTRHSATSYVPFQLLFRWLPNLPGVL